MRNSRWNYVLMEGDAKTRGVTHGEALADRIVDSLERADFMSRQDTSLPPFFPWGANDGKVYHAGTDPKDLTFQGIWGNSCGQEFDPDTFCDNHPQYEEFRSHMDRRPPGATWETFPPGT
ncbi:hypothetical protein ACFU6K_24440 [Kitasatospora sp. NPDC057512]|uniref:hypothetical protein n=1 Tax=Kitasatospora sp. NPDC057512 TaxID=3346154 RepID=UPI003684F616